VHARNELIEHKSRHSRYFQKSHLLVVTTTLALW